MTTPPSKLSVVDRKHQQPITVRLSRQSLGRPLSFCASWSKGLVNPTRLSKRRHCPSAAVEEASADEDGAAAVKLHSAEPEGNAAQEALLDVLKQRQQALGKQRIDGE